MAKVYKMCQKPGCRGAELGFLWDSTKKCPRCGSRLLSSDEQMQESFQKLAASLKDTREITEQISLPPIKDDKDRELERVMSEAVRIMFPEFFDQGLH